MAHVAGSPGGRRTTGRASPGAASTGAAGVNRQRELVGSIESGRSDGAALLVELLFSTLGLIPQQRNALVVEASIDWDYTTWLNIAFLSLVAALVWRFLRTGGLEMLRMMNRPMEAHHGHHA